MRLKIGVRVLVAAASFSAIASVWGSSSIAAASSNGGSTYTIGVLGDLTGFGASSDGTLVSGVKAGVHLAKQEGYNLKYVVADTGTSPTQALSGAQQLVLQDHVLAVIAVSDVTFAAASFLTSHGVPVVGTPTDGTEWNTTPNMISPSGYYDPSMVSTTVGKVMKAEGVKDTSVVGYGIGLAITIAKSFAASAASQGIKVGYLNTTFPYGGTNYQPVALAMKSAGVDGLLSPTTAETGLGLIVALREAGVQVKGFLGSGYGGDLTQGGPGAEQAAQGVYFWTNYEPVEMHTAATERFQNALRSSGSSTDPTFARVFGYLSVDTIVQGLKAAGSDATQASLLKGLQGLHKYNAAGLYGSYTVDIGYPHKLTALAPDDCEWFTKLVGTHFQLVPGLDPVCGKTTSQTIPSS